MLLTVGVVLKVIIGVSTECGQRGSQEWYIYDGHCYFKPAFDDLRTFNEAFLRCKELDSYLVSVTSRNESQFLVRDVIRCNEKQQCFLKKPNYSFWIGLRKNITERIDGLSLTKRRANWTWQNGDDYSWQNWHPEAGKYEAEPDIDSGYVRMHAYGQWADREPSDTYRYICEKSDMVKTTPPSGHVQSDVTSETGTPSLNGITIGPMVATIDSDKYIYVGVALACLFVAGIVIVVFVLLWKRRSSRSHIAREVPHTTGPSGHGPADTTRDEHEYTKLADAPLSATGGPQPHSTPSNGDHLYEEIAQNDTKFAPVDTAELAGDEVTALYSVPHGGRGDHDADDHEVTMVENSVYSS